MERGFPFGEPEKLLHTKRKLLERLKLFYRVVILQRILLGKGVGAFFGREGEYGVVGLREMLGTLLIFAECLMIDRCPPSLQNTAIYRGLGGLQLRTSNF